MIQLKIKNCNNIENGEFDITEGRLNIKYAINGTGKSTISKAIEAFVTNDQEKEFIIAIQILWCGGRKFTRINRV